MWNIIGWVHVCSIYALLEYALIQKENYIHPSNLCVMRERERERERDFH